MSQNKMGSNPQVVNQQSRITLAFKKAMRVGLIGFIAVTAALVVRYKRASTEEVVRQHAVSKVEFIPGIWSGTERVELSENQGIVIRHLINELESEKAIEFQATATFVAYGQFEVDGEKYIWNNGNLYKSGSNLTHRMISSPVLQTLSDQLKFVLDNSHSSKLDLKDWEKVLKAIAR